MFIVTFNAHGGKVSPASRATGEDGKLASLPTPTREGFAFRGWFTEEDSVTTSTVFRADAVVHATWNIIHYTITFDATGGTVSPPTRTTGPHWELDSLPTPTREGYTFNGWYTEKTGGIHVVPHSTPLIGDISIYAHWANPPSLVDSRDGKSYREVAIGEQIWMAENLNYAGAGCELGVCYGYDTANCETYGRLYNWDEAMKACPVGWRLPTDDDWAELVDFVGGGGWASKKLKSATGWYKSSGDDFNGTDDFGFTALPGGFGYVVDGGGFHDIAGSGDNAFWWSASELNSGEASYWMIYGGANGVQRYSREGDESWLFSVRCLQD
jgi:uncharacterized protein (TIGR02145 family)/uncharacterized repeat protein (TIGR02543 family)